MEPPVSELVHPFRDRGIKPPIGIPHATLGELFCTLVHIASNKDPIIKEFIQNGGIIYPQLLIPLLKAEEIAEPAIQAERPVLSNWNPLYWAQSVERWYQSKELSEKETKPPSSTQSTEEVTWSSYIKSTLGFMLQGLWRPSIILEPSICKNPSEPIRCFSWHRYKTKLAVATQDHVVKVYDMNTNQWSQVELKHEFQKNIFAISWKPLSGNTIAVAVRHGVFIWNIISKQVPIALPTSAQISHALTGSTLPTTTTAVDSTAWCNYLRYPGYSPVNTMDWSPNGRYLAIGSIHSGQMLIWDVILEWPTPLVQYCPGNIRQVIWSPDNQYICVLTALNTFRVFQTRNWVSEKWSDLSAPPHSAAWSGDGSHLALTVKGEAKIYIIRYENQGNDVRGLLVSTVDMSPYSVVPRRSARSWKPNESLSSEEIYGGVTTFVAWDPTSSRLAAAIEGTSLVALFQIDGLFPTVLLQPVGYLCGPPNLEVTGLYFKPHFKRGALLAVTYSNGQISFFPLYFNTLRSN